MSISRKQFVSSLCDSGLLSADEVAAIEHSLPPGSRGDVADSLSTMLVETGRVTQFQAGLLRAGRAAELVRGNYVILDEIGAGGMGQVYKAEHRVMERIVALKVLPAATVDSSDAVKRFHCEVKVAAKLSHPNIVTAYDAAEDGGEHYLVMEYVEGRDLGQIVKELGPLPLEQAIECILQAARGLQYAHQQGIVHRDIKPANLLLASEGVVKILDMGLARIETSIGGADATAAEGLTQPGQIMGTCDYMSPEQAMDTRKADARSDVYSLGCTLYRLLTGNPPYARDTVMKMLIAHRESPVPSLRAARADVPRRLETLYQRMLAKDPDRRPRAMSEVVGELEAVLAGKEAPAGDMILPAEEPSGASQLSAFIDSLGGSRQTSAVGTQSRAPAVVPEETIKHQPQTEDTGIQVTTRKSRYMYEVTRRNRKILAIGGLSIAICLAATLGLIFTPSGPDEDPLVDRASDGFQKKAAPTVAKDTSKPGGETARGDPPVAERQALRITTANGWVDLLSLVEVEHDAVDGNWQMRHGQLIAPTTPAARCQVPYIPPDEYDFRVVAEQLSGWNRLMIGLGVGSSRVLAVLGAWGNERSGLDVVDGRRANVNETTHIGRIFTPGKKATIVCKVRSGHVVVTVDGRSIIDWQGDWRRLSPLKTYEVPQADCLFLSTSRTSFRVTEMTLRPVAGKGRLLRMSDAKKTKQNSRITDR